MNHDSDDHPRYCLQMLLLENCNHNPDLACRGERTCIEVLVHDVKRRARSRHRHQGCNQPSTAPRRPLRSKTKPPQLPTSNKECKNAGTVPSEKHPLQRQMRDTDRPCDQIGEQSQSRMRSEKTVVNRIELRIQQLLDSRNVDFCIFYERMIAVHQDCPGTQQ